VNDKRPLLTFVSPLFLFPNDAGGKIRTTNILRGLKGGAFRVRLLSPATPAQASQWVTEIEDVCDEFAHWAAPTPKPQWLRGFDLLGAVPVNVAADATQPARAALRGEAAAGRADLMVFDFVHASVLRPAGLRCPTVCFTHNVEAEIFARHAAQARDPARRWMWRSQHAKMVRFEGDALRAYDKVIAVSERDARHFREAYRVRDAMAIPTGVDLDHFAYALPPATAEDGAPSVVFTGSMDSAANIEGVQFFLQQVWAQVLAEVPAARLRVVGRHPPAALVALGRRVGNVEFTGFVDDVRPHMRASQVAVIPLNVGGGTRIKAFEAMAMGLPVVSTAVGIEGLDVVPGRHFLLEDTAAGFARAVVRVLREEALRDELSCSARALVEERFGHRVAARVFEDICVQALAERRAAA
jgi:polysaccharide biosynthesis protein PslH